MSGSDAHGSQEGKPRGPRRRGVDTRRAVLAAARVEFAAKGFAGGSMRSIARSVGLELAHVQHHFGDKPSLWAAVLSDVIGRQAREMDVVFERYSDRPPEEILSRMMESLVQYAATHSDFLALLSQARFSVDSAEARAYRIEIAPGARRMIGLIRQAQDRGRFVQGRPELLFYQLVGAALRIFTAAADAAVLIGRSPTDAEMVSDQLTLCLSVFMPTTSGDFAAASGKFGRRSADERSGLQPAKPRPALIYLLGQVNSLVGKALGDGLRRLRLTQSQMVAMTRIADDGELSSARLARLLDVTPQSVMVMVKALEAQGYVSRRQSPTSRRTLAIDLTDAGKHVLEELRQLAGRTERELLEGLGPADRRIVVDALMHVLEHRRPLALSEWAPLIERTPD